MERKAVLLAQKEFYEKILKGEDRKPEPLDERALLEVKKQLRKLGDD